MTKPTVWTIAGSDCSAGAGIQADIKTAHGLGVDVRSVITAVTAQNSQGVLQVNAVSNSAILAQLQALEADGQAKVIKIGLLANSQQVELVAAQIQQYKNHWSPAPQIIYDPVAVSSSGGLLTEDDILPNVIDKLLPLVDVLTPNAMEAQSISGHRMTTWRTLEIAAQKIMQLGCKAVIIKGGHLHFNAGKQAQYCVDYGFDGKQIYCLASHKISTHHTHGSGCTYASAVASLLALNYLLRDAMTIAKAYINQSISTAVQYQPSNIALWQGAWPNERHYYPTVLVPNSDLAKALHWQPATAGSKALVNEPSHFANDFPRLSSDSVGFYPVVDSIDWLERLLKMGVSTLQYREKKLQGAALSEAISQAVALGKQYQARLFINDYWQLAIQHQAYGVHLGQEDISSADLPQIKNAGLRLGISTHGHYEYLKMMEYRPSYLAIGAIFPTTTKDMTGQIQGMQTLAKIMALATDIPTVAIGGINLQRAKQVLDTGVSGIAVVTAVTEAANPQSAVRQFQQLISARALS
ncbi:thiamine phosphate synthase [Alteromonadaceae bacterium BrNp21-10]|nr:thiamine phosphate synthase [Alteromonadaceae bacterium BrNp21-10]